LSNGGVGKMAIQKISVENFTVFENVEIGFCDGVNIFIGENGTGKTHLLKLLYAICNCTAMYNEKENHKVLRSLIGEINYCFWGGVSDLCKLYRKRTLGEINHMPISVETKEESYSFENSLSKDEVPILTFKGMESKKQIPAVFIPAKDMLTHSKGLLAMSKKYSKDMPFDKTLLDIVEKANLWKVDYIPDIAKFIIPIIEKNIEGKIIIEGEHFYVEKVDGKLTPFSYEAEGIKKLGLLWQLLMNESITKDTVIFWDEPEANLNPKLVPVIVDILLELARNGVQIFIATHDYVISKYFEVKRKQEDNICFHSLYKTESSGIKCESNTNFRDLKENAINTALDILMDEVIDRNVGD